MSIGDRLFFCPSVGCDSIVSLYLTVNQPASSVVMDTICHGGSYSFGGKTYYTATVAYDTVPSAVGCDSIVTLYLSVTPAMESTQEVHLCYGTTTDFYGRTISETGVYTDTIVSSTGCDSIVTWNVSVMPDFHSLERAVICNGQEYTSADGKTFVGLSRERLYELQVKSVDGCDSVAQLQLWVISASREINDTIEADELPYIVNGQELFAADINNHYSTGRR